MKKFMFAAISVFFSSFAFAVVDSGDRQITSFGTQGGGATAIAYITVSPPTSVNCAYGVLYIFNATEPAAKPAIATALAAYTSGKPLKRVDYDIKMDGTCAITLINF